MDFDYLLKYLWFVNSGTFFEKLNNFSGFLKTFYVNKIVHNLHHTHTCLIAITKIKMCTYSTLKEKLLTIMS